MDFYSTAADSYSILEDYEKAIHYYKKAIQLGLEANQVGIAISYYIEKAETEIEKGDTLTAINTYKTASILNEKTKISATASILGEITQGMYAYYLNRFTDAKKHLNIAINSSETYDRPHLMSCVYLVLGEIASKEKRFYEAIEYNQKGLKIAQEFGYISDQEVLLSGLYANYRNLGKYKIALKYLDKAQVLREQILNKDKIKILAKQQAKNKFALERQEITFKHQVELQNETQKRKNILNGVIGVFGLFTLGIIVYFNQKKRKIAEHEQQAQEEFTQKLLQNTEDERSRIAGDLHDSISHQLLQLKQKAKNGKSIKDHELSKVIEKVRTISHNLSPTMFEQIGLVKSIEELCRNIMKTNPILICTQLNYNKSLGKLYELQIYRVIEEVFNNIIKHSEATHAIVKLIDEDSELKINIKDNGKGFNTSVLESQKPTFGITNMKQRAKNLNGKINFISNNKGTEFNLKIVL